MSDHGMPPTRCFDGQASEMCFQSLLGLSREARSGPDGMLGVVLKCQACMRQASIAISTHPMAQNQQMWDMRATLSHLNTAI